MAASLVGEDILHLLAKPQRKLYSQPNLRCGVERFKLNLGKDWSPGSTLTTLGTSHTISGPVGSKQPSFSHGSRPARLRSLAKRNVLKTLGFREHLLSETWSHLGLQARNRGRGL
jgi:hypothetical protein